MRLISRVQFTGLACAGLALSACASTPAPTAALARAEAAIARAQQEQAATHAPLPLRDAQEKLDKARQAVRDERNTEAQRLAEQSAVDAELAIATDKRARTEEAVTELSDTIDVLRREVKP